jgi:hypothetical protein
LHPLCPLYPVLPFIGISIIFMSPCSFVLAMFPKWLFRIKS